jgi:hypothetical protein
LPCRSSPAINFSLGLLMVVRCLFVLSLTTTF